jgi:hypothetical protein
MRRIVRISRCEVHNIWSRLTIRFVAPRILVRSQFRHCERDSLTMNAIMALLTAASLLAHAALGCCIHHSHAPNVDILVGHAAPPSDANHKSACGHCCDHCPNSQEGHCPAVPGGNCDEQDCVAVAGGPGTIVLKAVQTAFNAAGLADLLAVSASSADYVQSAELQHDLGPPVRPHLLIRVLLL